MNVKFAILCFLLCKPLFMLASEKNDQNSKIINSTPGFIPDEDDEPIPFQKISALEEAISKKPLLYDKGRQMYYTAEESAMLKEERQKLLSKYQADNKKSQSK